MTKNETKAAEAAVAPKAEKAPKIEQHGVARPKVGTSTERVWAIADAKSKELGAPAPRKDVLEQAEKEEINVSTAATQYGRWRKFNGLKAEVKAPVEKAPKAPKEPKAPKAKKVKAEPAADESDEGAE